MRGGKSKKSLALVDFVGLPRLQVFHITFVNYVSLAFRQNLRSSKFLIARVCLGYLIVCAPDKAMSLWPVLNSLERC